jgi:hypothetical protein
MGALRGLAQLEQLACQRDRLAEVHCERPLPVSPKAQPPDLLPQRVFGAACDRELDHRLKH